MKILIFGTFDHLHPGHEFVINAAIKRGDVTVIVARDSNVKRIKGRQSDQSEGERMRVLQESFPVVTVQLGDPTDFLAPVRAVYPDLILLGYDQKLPPGVSEKDFPCPVERLPAFNPNEYKSSIRRKEQREQEGQR